MNEKSLTLQTLNQLLDVLQKHPAFDCTSRLNHFLAIAPDPISKINQRVYVRLEGRLLATSFISACHCYCSGNQPLLIAALEFLLIIHPDEKLEALIPKISAELQP